MGSGFIDLVKTSNKWGFMPYAGLPMNRVKSHLERLRRGQILRYEYLTKKITAMNDAAKQMLEKKGVEMGEKTI